MAELDRFERTFAAGWRAAYNYARGGVASDSEIGDKLIKSLARTLREGGGIPGLPEMGAVVANGLGVSIHESFRRIGLLSPGSPWSPPRDGRGRRRKVPPNIPRGVRSSERLE